MRIVIDTCLIFLDLSSDGKQSVSFLVDRRISTFNWHSCLSWKALYSMTMSIDNKTPKGLIFSPFTLDIIILNKNLSFCLIVRLQSNSSKLFSDSRLLFSVFAPVEFSSTQLSSIQLN